MHPSFIVPFFILFAHAQAYAYAQSQYDSAAASWVPCGINETAGAAIKVLAGLLLLATSALFFAMWRNKHKNDSLQTSPPAIRIQETTRQYYECKHGRSENYGRPQVDGMKGANMKLV